VIVVGAGAAGLAPALRIAGVTHDWSTDPFACGAYSYVAAGAGAARAALQDSVDETLFFAGEATASDGQGGTVSGALATEMRELAVAERAVTCAESASC